MPACLRNRVIPTAPPRRLVKSRLGEEEQRNNRGHYTTHRVLLHAPPEKSNIRISAHASVSVEVQIVGSFTRLESHDFVSGQTLDRKTVPPGASGAAMAQRHEEIFYSLREVQVVAERWRIHYNTVATHVVRLSATRTEAWQTESEVW
jgi:hypothetical protein